MVKFISKRDNIVLDALFYFELGQRFYYRGDMFSLKRFSYRTSKEVFQLLELRYLFLRLRLSELQ